MSIPPVQRVFSGAQWEAIVGYCRAVRVGNQIWVSGTAPVADQGNVFAPGDAYAQAQRCFEIIQVALQALEADCRDVVRSRLFVTDISRWAEFARAHQEFFGEHPPATSMIEVKALIDPDMLIEVEVDAICSNSLSKNDGMIHTPENCQSLEDVRMEIDRLDAQLVQLLGQRLKYVQQAAQFKTGEASVQAPERIASMLQQRRTWAESAGLNPTVVEKLYRDLIDYFVNAEMQHWRSQSL